MSSQQDVKRKASEMEAQKSKRQASWGKLKEAAYFMIGNVGVTCHNLPYAGWILMIEYSWSSRQEKGYSCIENVVDRYLCIFLFSFLLGGDKAEKRGRSASAEGQIVFEVVTGDSKKDPKKSRLLRFEPVVWAAQLTFGARARHSRPIGAGRSDDCAEDPSEGGQEAVFAETKSK